MGHFQSDDEHDIPSSDSIRKRFKFPKKSPEEDCSGVHLTSVPRKIRSAFKKKSCGSTSPNLLACKKLKWKIDGVEFHRKNGLMKSGLMKSVLEKDNKSVNSLPLSKDEEEVAQALFALSSIIPNSEKTCNYELDGEQSGVKTTNSGCLNEEEVVRNAGVDSRAPLENPPVIKGPASDGISTKDNFVDSNKSWKRCLRHAYISHYIKDSINRVPLYSSKKISEWSNSGDPGGRLRKRLLGVGTSSNGSDSPSCEKNDQEVRNAVIMQKRLAQYQQQHKYTKSLSGQKQVMLSPYVGPTHIGLSPLSAPTQQQLQKKTPVLRPLL